ncbi:NAD-dependent epimerase/dehydratase family protein [Marinilongibacter aquaticus]|uniref:NAD-dependent epimerase/dehydratase family protein n=1 Tax=Marinilongibacter aquaticus TaxID=2975157 RepID=UPI0021BD6B8C|nr:NAD-dependent epimerase/dehydratase family protein [Marinilongibacter aquaticus]UBM57649.1 NAD-dependent epimerase/dehydratase family protein [Marinilongibacter aquaticus]
MDVLITGASGFVGVNLINYLNSAEGVKHSSISLRKVSDFTIRPEVNAIVHLAGKAHDLKGVSSEDEYYTVNTDLTKMVFDAFLESKAEVFIFVSSIKAVIDKLEDGVLTEGMKENPQTPYGKSKLLAEQYIVSKELPSDKRVYVLRPCMVHGPRNRGNLSLLYAFVNKGLPYPLGAYDNKRSLLGVENLAFVMKELLFRRDVESGIYHVSDDEAISTLAIVELFAKQMTKNITVLKLPKGIIRFIAGIGDKWKFFPLNSERLDKLTSNYVVSNEKLMRALGKELPFSVKESLLKTVKSFKE